MKTTGISLVWILLSGTLVAPVGILTAFGTDQTVPFPPTGLNATTVSGTQVFLSWIAPINATQSGVIGYKIEINPSCSNSFIFLANITSTNFLSTGLTNGTCYQYRVSAINSVGISNTSNIATTTTLSVPSAPTNLIALAVSSSKINLSWNAPSSNGGTIITGYKIERRNSCAGNFVVISNTGNASTTYSDAGLSANTCYQYRVSGHNAIGIGLISNNATAITMPTPTQIHVPDAPTGLSVTTLSSTSLKLTWNAPSNNGGAAINGYLIQRNGTTIVNNTFTNQTVYIDTNLSSLHQQTYDIAAWNSAGLGSFSNTASGITNSTSIIPPIGNQTNLGQLISEFTHKRNELLKQQRAEIIKESQECRIKIKDASDTDKKQIKEDCKQQIKQIKEKYKGLLSQLKEQFSKLRSTLQSQIKEENKQHETDEKELKTQFKTQMNEEKEQYNNSTKELKDQFKTQLDEIKKQYKNNMQDLKTQFKNKSEELKKKHNHEKED